MKIPKEVILEIGLTWVTPSIANLSETIERKNPQKRRLDLKYNLAIIAIFLARMDLLTVKWIIIVYKPVKI